MNGKENIINKILADAEAKCTEILNVAKSQAEQVADSARQLSEREKQAVETRLEKLATERKGNYLATAQLEARKYRLGKKQELISRCYAMARQRLVDMSASQKAVFIGKLIENFAEEGEVVRISKKDRDVVTQKFLDGFGKKLTLGKKFIDADGGIVLEASGYDKDITLDKIVATSRESTEVKVAHVLFGE